MHEPTLDERSPEVRVEFSIARAEVAGRWMATAFAEQSAAIVDTLHEAREHPEVFVGSGFLGHRADAVAFAERAAIADLAVRLGLAESTIRNRESETRTLRERAPLVWARMCSGDIAAAQGRVVADVALTLPPESWADFERAVLDAAERLAPARFRTFARAARERIRPDSAAEAHRQRVGERRVWVEHDLDGMSWLTAYLPAAVAQRAMAHLDRAALSLAKAPDEQRTVAQLRADVAGDLLAGVLGCSNTSGAGVAVAVTVPVFTLLGNGEEPGTLEGYGPIDADTARSLAAHAPSFVRILTHPVTGTVLDVDRTTYRVPADLKRWLKVRDNDSCTFAGCGRSAAECDVDHTVPWAEGGTTSATNLAHLCRSHHRLKHESLWRMTQSSAGITWTSPTGFTTAPDPPPF
jgi:hypothetical protein